MKSRKEILAAREVFADVLKLYEYGNFERTGEDDINEESLAIAADVLEWVLDKENDIEDLLGKLKPEADKIVKHLAEEHGITAH